MSLWHSLPINKEVNIRDLQRGDSVTLYTWNKGQKALIKKTRLSKPKVAICDTITLHFEDGNIAKFCFDGEVSSATKRRYFNDIAYTYKGKRTLWQKIMNKWDKSTLNRH